MESKRQKLTGNLPRLDLGLINDVFDAVADIVLNLLLQFLTDAGQYVVRFGDVLPKGSIHNVTPESEDAEERKPFLLSKSETTGGAEIQQLREAADKVHNFSPK